MLCNRKDQYKIFCVERYINLLSHLFMHSSADSCLCALVGIEPAALAYLGNALTELPSQGQMDQYIDYYLSSQYFSNKMLSPQQDVIIFIYLLLCSQFSTQPPSPSTASWSDFPLSPCIKKTSICQIKRNTELYQCLKYVATCSIFCSPPVAQDCYLRQQF